MEGQPYQLPPMTTLSLLEELMSSGLLQSDFNMDDGVEEEQSEYHVGGNQPIPSSQSSPHDASLARLMRSSMALQTEEEDEDDDDDDPPLFMTMPDFVLSQLSAESVDSDLSDDDDDDDDDDDSLALSAVFVSPLQPQPGQQQQHRPGLQEDDASLKQQHQQGSQQQLLHASAGSSSRMLWQQHAGGNSSRVLLYQQQQQHRPGLQEADGDTRAAEPITNTMARTQTSTTKSSLLLSSRHPISPTTTALTQLNWTSFMTLQSTSTSSSQMPTTTAAVVFEDYRNLHRSFRVGQLQQRMQPPHSTTTE